MIQQLAQSQQPPKVVRIDLHRVAMPFSDLARSAMDQSENGLGMAIPAEEPWEHGDFLFCRLVDEDGNEGWAETFVWTPESGVGTEEIRISIQQHLGRYVLGQDSASVRAIKARMDRNVARTEIAKGLLDQACYALTANRLGCPVHDLIGGRSGSTIPMAGLIPLASPSDTAELAMAYVEGGYGTLRLKLGTGIANDEATMTAVRDAVGPDVRLRVDYNQAYQRHDAVRALRAIEPIGIDAAEQPLAMGDIMGMVDLQGQTSIPLFLHEGFFSVADAVSLAALGGTKVLGVNLERPGGITAAMDLMDWAAVQGIGTIIHNQSLGLATAAQVHLAASRADRLGHAPELAGDLMFANSLVKDPLRIVDGQIPIPTGPGWGVELDLDALADHSVGETVTMTMDDLEQTAAAA